MFKNIILTAFSLASIFGMNLILFDKDIKLNNTKNNIYSKTTRENRGNFLDYSNYSKPKIVQNTQVGVEENSSNIDSYIRRLMSEAYAFSEKEKYLEAIKKYDEVISLTQKSKDIKALKTFAGANYLKAYLYYYFLDNSQKAILAYDRVIKRFENSSNVELLKLYFKAQKYKLQLVDNKEALQIYQDISEKFKNSTDEELIKMYLFAQEHIASTIESENQDQEELLKTYDNIIEKVKYSNNPDLLKYLIKAEDGKIRYLILQNRIEEAIEVYDETIERLKEEGNLYYREIISLMLSESYYLASYDKSRSLELLDEIIDKETQRGSVSSRDFEFAVINALELAVVSDIDESKYKELLEENFSGKSDMMAEYEMLRILQNAQYSNQDKELRDWEIKYGDYRFEDWDFSNLDEWSREIKDPIAKERVATYLAFFKNRV